MSLIHDVIKIKYIELGYLPDYPYHLISDAEMCDAFLHRDTDGYSVFDPDTQISLYNSDIKVSGYFVDTYNLLSMKNCKQYSNIQKCYVELIRAMLHYIDDLRSSFDTDYVLPDWMYQYMLGSVIHENSSEKDRHDSLVLFDSDNIDDAFTAAFYDKVFISSKYCINKLNRDFVHISSSLYSSIKQYPDVVQETKPDGAVVASLLLPLPSPFVTPSVIKYARLLNLEPNSNELKDWRYQYIDRPTYTISYDSNKGDNAPVNQTKYKDDPIRLSQKTPRREGYMFSEWNTKEDGTGTSYQPYDQYTANSNLLLYAQWSVD